MHTCVLKFGASFRTSLKTSDSDKLKGIITAQMFSPTIVTLIFKDGETAVLAQFPLDRVEAHHWLNVAELQEDWSSLALDAG